MTNRKTGAVARFFMALYLLTGSVLLISPPLWAGDIAVLDFELNDLTRVADNSDEVKRTASLAPMLRDILTNTHGYVSIAIPTETYQNANQGFGYLFDHADAAAQLGQNLGAEWVVINRLHKPSFLFSYLITQVVNVKTGLAYPELIVEIKGQQEKMNQRGLKKLAGKIANQITAFSGAATTKN